MGLSRTLNKGLEDLIYKYEYIARMYADDWSFSNRFNFQIDFLDNKDFGMCVTQGLWLDDLTLTVILGYILKTLEK